MRTIAICNQKGGVGKTTIAVLLADAATRAGNRVLLVDLEPQANATAASAVDVGGGVTLADVLVDPRRQTLADAILIIDPDLLDTAKDPGELIRQHGADAWQRTATAPICGVTWRALDLTGPTTTSENEPAKRAALTRAEAWLSHLPARLAVEQTTALNLVANTLDHDPAAVRRAFRARRWNRNPTPITDRSRTTGIAR